jgi:hypothetical protein
MVPKRGWPPFIKVFSAYSSELFGFKNHWHLPRSRKLAAFDMAGWWKRGPGEEFAGS